MGGLYNRCNERHTQTGWCMGADLLTMLQLPPLLWGFPQTIAYTSHKAGSHIPSEAPAMNLRIVIESKLYREVVKFIAGASAGLIS